MADQGNEAAERAQWEARHDAYAGEWDDVAPGYRYGQEMRREARYQGRTWAEVEPELRAGYPEWARQRGYAAEGERGESVWDRIKDAVREAWETVEKDIGAREQTQVPGHVHPRQTHPPRVDIDTGMDEATLAAPGHDVEMAQERNRGREERLGGTPPARDIDLIDQDILEGEDQAEGPRR